MSAADPLCHELSATAVVDHLRQGRLGLSEYVAAMHEHTVATEPTVNAFAHYSTEVVGQQVERLSTLKNAGQGLPSLFGLPVAIKDNIDTCDYPTELGYVASVGRSPRVDALLVHKLREAGAVVWAKSRTTELAYMHPTVTTNPAAPGHTPGGSSSGSASAVACGMVPAAIGTQTNGSVIRPASFCGIYGFKPSRGLIFNGGVLPCSPSLDQVGVFARSAEDLAAVTEVMIGGHQLDGGKVVFPMRLQEVCAADPPLAPKLMFARTPLWDQMDIGAQAAFDALAEELRDCMVDVALPDSVGNAVPWLKTVMEAEMHVNLKALVAAGGEQASAAVRGVVARGSQILAADYLEALARLQGGASGFNDYFDHFDAIVAPASLGPAPEGLTATGNAVMSTIWTFAGLPCVSIPLLQTSDGLPLGVQLIGPLNGDARLLRTARWLAQRLQS